MANTSDNFAYIWPNSKYFAINLNKNAYININGESLSKCKKLNNRYICQETEPSRPLNEYAECEVKLAAKIGIRDWSQCEIRLVKLDTTFCTRLSSPNSWVFSTKGRDELTISCKRSADLNINIEGLDMLKLPIGCAARSNSERLIAAREIVTNFMMQAFDEVTLNISEILRDSNIIENTLIDLKTSELSSVNGATTRVLKSGKDLREIINKARALGQYRAMTSDLVTFRNVVIHIFRKLPHHLYSYSHNNYLESASQKGGPNTNQNETIFRF